MRSDMRMALVALVLTGSAGGDALCDVLVLKDGTMLHGRVGESGPGDVTFIYDREGVPVTARYEREQLDPHSWYIVRSRAVGHDARSRLELARYCIDSGLFAVAERELERVRALDPSLSELVEEEKLRVRDGGAAALLALARESLAEGDPDRAWQTAGTVLTRYRGSASQDEARGFLDLVEEAREARAREELARTRAAEDAEEAEVRSKRLRPAILYLDQGRKKVLSGLRDDNLNSSLNAFVSAARAYQNALRKAEEIERRFGNDQELVRLLAEVRDEASRGIVDAHVNMGSLYVVRGSFIKALQHANEAIAAGPDSSSARAFRARVEIASAEATRARFRR